MEVTRVLSWQSVTATVSDGFLAARMLTGELVC